MTINLSINQFDRALLRPLGDGVTVLWSPVSHLRSFIATYHTQTHLTGQFFIAAASQLPDIDTPHLASHLRPLLKCLILRDWL